MTSAAQWPRRPPRPVRRPHPGCDAKRQPPRRRRRFATGMPRSRWTSGGCCQSIAGGLAPRRARAPRRAPPGTPAAGPAAGAETATLVIAAAWGPGAGWLLDVLPAMLGADDQPETFSPVHPLLREMALRHRGVRVGRSCRVLEALVPAILEQKVVGLEAFRAWRL